MSANPFPPEHAIARSTVRILAGTDPANLTSVGTGFYYQVTHPTTNQAKVLIVTNKHVVRGAQIVQFVASSAANISVLDAHAQPVGRVDQVINWPLAGNLHPHPDPAIDLCGIDVTVPLGAILANGRQLRSMFLDYSWLPDSTSKSLMRDIEPVLVLGYPNGIWDPHNNMPIARLGTTATHPLALYQGKSDFLVDVAAFGGSSGSPVFGYEAPFFRQPSGAVTPGTKIQLLGVVWGVIEQSVTGVMQHVQVPAATASVPVLQTSLSLAIALHASAVLDLDELLMPGITAARA